MHHKSEFFKIYLFFRVLRFSPNPQISVTPQKSQKHASRIRILQNLLVFSSSAVRSEPSETLRAPSETLRALRNPPSPQKCSDFCNSAGMGAKNVHHKSEDPQKHLPRIRRISKASTTNQKSLKSEHHESEGAQKRAPQIRRPSKAPTTNQNPSKTTCFFELKEII